MENNAINAPVSAFGKTLIDDADQAAAVGTLFDNATLTSATVATGDLVLIQDISNGKAARTVTAQAIADLAGAAAAPADATYIVQTANATLSNEQVLGALATGIMMSANGTGVVSIATQGVDYYAPGGTDVAIADGGTGASTNTTAINNLVNNAALTTATVASGDLVLIQDVSDTNNLKSVTAQSIADLGPGGSAAPGDATYILQVPNGSLASAQNLAALATGIMKSTTATGVVSIATANVDFQAADATLISIAALGTAADRTIYTTGVDTWAETPITAAGRALIDDATAGDQRTTLGLGTIATQNSSSVSITGGSITGITDLVVADGGTGASSFVAYTPICGGTSTTNPLQSVVSLSTAGYVLTSNGAGALPTFQASGGGGGSGSSQFWIETNGAGTSILTSYNVSSIVDNGAGNLTVIFTTQFATANYVPHVSTFRLGNGYNPAIIAQSATQVNVANNNGSGLFTDPTDWYVSGFGNQ